MTINTSKTNLSKQQMQSHKMQLFYVILGTRCNEKREKGDEGIENRLPENPMLFTSFLSLPHRNNYNSVKLYYEGKQQEKGR